MSKVEDKKPRGWWHERARELYAQGWNKRQIARELGVGDSAVCKALNPERAKTQWRLYDERSKRPCPECGGPRSSRASLCEQCYTTPIRERDEQIVQWWHNGDSLAEIAERLGWTANHVGVQLWRLRRAGYDLPLRYAVENGKRIPAR